MYVPFVPRHGSCVTYGVSTEYIQIDWLVCLRGSLAFFFALAGWLAAAATLNLA